MLLLQRDANSFAPTTHTEVQFYSRLGRQRHTTCGTLTSLHFGCKGTRRAGSLHTSSSTAASMSGPRCGRATGCRVACCACPRISAFVPLTSAGGVRVHAKVADPWARLPKPARFSRDVRVIHPLKSKDNAVRAHQERAGPSKVPANHRAPNFQTMEPDLGPRRHERRPLPEPPLRLGGRLGGEGSVGVNAKRWNHKPGQVCVPVCRCLCLCRCRCVYLCCASRHSPIPTYTHSNTHPYPPTLIKTHTCTTAQLVRGGSPR
jgi:hypothetical protein